MTANRLDTRLAELAACVSGRTVRFATAESCTGGQLAAVLAGDETLGSHLERGFVVYSIDAKCEMLGIDRGLAEYSQGVSDAVTNALANAALDKSSADIAIAITGFCGPRQEDEEVGLVHIACAGHGYGLESRVCHFGDIGRRAVLDRAVSEALAMLQSAAELHFEQEVGHAYRHQK
jgi:nicotinamide-nucleotide amidase